MYAIGLSFDTADQGHGLWRLYPIGDLHVDKKAFDEDLFRAYVKHIAEDPHGVWISLGDYVDGTTPDNRYHGPSTLKLSTLEQMHHYIAWQLDRLEELFEPLKGKPGVMLEGNHDKFGGLRYSGFVWELARRIGAHFGGVEALIRATAIMPHHKRQGYGYNWVIYARHGSGGGYLPGGKINRLQNTSFSIAPRADIYLSAHVHDSMARILTVHDITRKGKVVLRKRPVALIIAPSFAQGRVAQVSGYEGERGLPATDQGIIYLEIENPRGDQSGGKMRRVEFLP